MIEDMTNRFTAQELEQITQIIQNAAPANAPAGGGEVKLAAPTPFEGSINQTTEFIDSVTDYVTANASRFSDDKRKIIFMKSYMKGGPREWARTKTEEYAGGQWPTFADFVDHFKEAYKPPNEANRARIELEKLNQAKLNPPTVTALNARFRTLVSKAGLSMTDTMLIPIYKRALGHDTLSVIYIKETLPTTLEGWLAKAQEVNGRNLELSDIRGGGKGFLSYSPSHKSNIPDYGEPMDIDAVRTGPPRPDTRSCYNCGSRGHISRTCPSPRTQQQGAGRGGGGWQGGHGGGQGNWQGGRGN